MNLVYYRVEGPTPSRPQQLEVVIRWTTRKRIRNRPVRLMMSFCPIEECRKCENQLMDGKDVQCPQKVKPKQVGTGGGSCLFIRRILKYRPSSLRDRNRCKWERFPTLWHVYPTHCRGPRPVADLYFPAIDLPGDHHLYQSPCLLPRQQAPAGDAVGFLPGHLGGARHRTSFTEYIPGFHFRGKELPRPGVLEGGPAATMRMLVIMDKKGSPSNARSWQRRRWLTPRCARARP